MIRGWIADWVRRRRALRLQRIFGARYLPWSPLGYRLMRASRACRWER